MNRAERLIRLHDLLRGPRPVAMAALTGSLEVSRATAVRDLGYLRTFFGAPVLYDREARGYRYDPKPGAFELPGFWLNESELYALLASAELLEQAEPGLLARDLGPLVSRIRRILESSGHPSGALADRIRLLPAAKRRVEPQRFAAAAEALLEGRTLDLDYDGRAAGEPTRRTVHPHRLVHYRDNWYLLAWCQKARELRLFALDRIRRAAVRGEPAVPREAGDLDAYVQATFGIFGGEPKGRAVLRFTPEASRWVADETWHPAQEGRWEGEAWELTLPYGDLRELTREVLKYGPDVLVLEPKELRDRVAEAHRRAAGLYGEE